MQRNAEVGLFTKPSILIYEGRFRKLSAFFFHAQHAVAKLRYVKSFLASLLNNYKYQDVNTKELVSPY
jgi:hypothetical protein